MFSLINNRFPNQPNYVGPVGVGGNAPPVSQGGTDREPPPMGLDYFDEYGNQPGLGRYRQPGGGEVMSPVVMGQNQQRPPFQQGNTGINPVMGRRADGTEVRLGDWSKLSESEKADLKADFNKPFNSYPGMSQDQVDAMKRQAMPGGMTPMPRGGGRFPGGFNPFIQQVGYGGGQQYGFGGYGGYAPFMLGGMGGFGGGYNPYMGGLGGLFGGMGGQGFGYNPMMGGFGGFGGFTPMGYGGFGGMGGYGGGYGGGFGGQQRGLQSGFTGGYDFAGNFVPGMPRDAQSFA